MQPNKYNLSEKELTKLYNEGWRWIVKSEHDLVCLFEDELMIKNLGYNTEQWVPVGYGKSKLVSFTTNRNWRDSLYEIKNPNVITLTLTNHKTTLEDQVLKIEEKKEEFDKARNCFLEDQTKHNASLVADEMLDFVKTNLKWLQLFCKSNDISFNIALKNNNNKNEA